MRVRLKLAARGLRADSASGGEMSCRGHLPRKYYNLSFQGVSTAVILVHDGSGFHPVGDTPFCVQFI